MKKEVKHEFISKNDQHVIFCSNRMIKVDEVYYIYYPFSFIEDDFLLSTFQSGDYFFHFGLKNK